MNNILGKSLIYGVRGHNISQILEVQAGTQQGNEYMNDKHRNAESDRNKRQEPYYRWNNRVVT